MLTRDLRARKLLFTSADTDSAGLRKRFILHYGIIATFFRFLRKISKILYFFYKISLFVAPNEIWQSYLEDLVVRIG